MSTRYSTMESIRQKVAMGSIASKGDPELKLYVGSDWDTSLKLANIDTIIENGLIPQEYIPFLKLARRHLDKKRKAHFMTIGTDVISKLAVIIGDRTVTTNAKDKIRIRIRRD